MKDKADYSLYKCPYAHLEKECGHKLRGPEGYEGVYGVWCPCGFRGPVFYLDPDDLGLEKIDMKITTESQYTAALKRISELWGAPPGTQEGDELDVLIEAVHEYEDVNHAVPGPGME